MSRDSLFWSVVGALAVGTALLTAYGTTSRAAAGEAAPAVAIQAATASVRPAPRALLSAQSRADAPTAATRSAPPIRATVEPARAAAATEAREALQPFVQLSRERRAIARRGAQAPPLDPKSGMPPMELSFEQYRLWAKLGDRLAARDYRAVEELQPELGEQFEPELVDGALDALASDYAAYLADVGERNCAAMDPASVWRKVGFMALWLTRLERRSEELERQERDALRACGY